ncbi:MAG: glutamine-hydrolyzing GMP synthase [Dehalococcoidales bacterium]|jgi:GMP synthase (glutamine-hydrolysing)|nr:glutamine-hydrolyzing GMP synthase [Dehalococcoidales bacterium]NLE90535.1 glutamine-hydrolyzing GMP synthase [Dehalococcoidales bacterium]
MTEETQNPDKEEAYRVSTSGDIEVSTYLEISREIKGEQPLASDSIAPTKQETIIIIDFGSQYTLLIARRIRELDVYCELISHDTPWEKISHLNPKGFILSGGPSSVYAPDAPLAPSYVYSAKLPILGICYGQQVLAYQLGGKVETGDHKEYGHSLLNLNNSDSPLFADIPDSSPVWMSHGDRVVEMPPGFTAMAYTENSPVAVMGSKDNVFGMQFHPEVSHTPYGKTLLKNFVYNICGCHGNWTTGNFINESINHIRREVGKGKVIAALSGGVDSSVVATLIHRAIGDQLTCIFVNNGLLRRQEGERTLKVFRQNLGMRINYVDATDRFLNRLKGITDPETKRKTIGAEFISTFEEEASKIGKVDFLAQGTLYPDVIESVSSVSKASAKIKTHHNVGGLPSNMTFKLLEPLRFLFKDEVRKVGLELGLPEEMVWRQPFPGPGLAIRIIGEVTREKLDILRNADWIVMNEIKKAKLYGELWQSFAILTDVKSVGVMGDFRTYGYLVALRAVTSIDAMTADWARLPYDLLANISNRIVNEVDGVNRVVYDITSKPPGTIEWE